MMEKPKLSIIMPVYNGAGYLGRMIDSVCAQTMDAFELLIVDNASSDTTGQIIAEYQQKDTRIRGLYQKKPGVSAARNMALAQVRGEFVMFLDGDDWIDDDYLETMTRQMQDVDLVSGGYRAYAEKKESGTYRYECFYESPRIETVTYTAERMLERLFQITHYQGYVWNKCYRTEVIREHGISFHEDISYNEDRLFTVEYLCCCKGQTRMIGENKYHYILHEGSAVSAEQAEFPAEKEFTEIEAFARMLEKLKGYPEAMKLAKENMAKRELLLFQRMVDPHGFARYRKSRRMRYHARHFKELSYDPVSLQEKKLCSKLIFYGWTGFCYGKKQEL